MPDSLGGSTVHRPDVREAVSRHIDKKALRRRSRGRWTSSPRTLPTGQVSLRTFRSGCTSTRQHGRTLLDRELYLPKVWTEDPDRCAAAGIPDGQRFATKPELAAMMLRRAYGAGISAQWVSADAVYSQQYKFRETCEELGYRYVLAIPASQRVKSCVTPKPRQ